jgi:hypothetical protein
MFKNQRSKEEPKKAGKEPNKQLTTDNNQFAAQAIVQLMMELCSATKSKRWECGDNIILGRMNMIKLRDDLTDACLTDLIEGKEPFVTEARPQPLGSLDDFIASRMIRDPGQFDLDKFKRIYVITKIEGAGDIDEDDDSEDTMIAVNQRIEGLRGGGKAAYKTDLINARAAHEAKLETFHRDSRDAETSYDRKVDTYYRRKESYERNKEKFNEKVSQFTQLMKKYFSDNVMKISRPEIEKNDFEKALENIIDEIFKGTAKEGTYLKTILEHSSFIVGMNLELMIRIIFEIFHLADLCHSSLHGSG